MATIFSHAIAAVAVGTAVRPQETARFWLLTATCAMLPDSDVLAFSLGVPYGSAWGHRGFTHSILFAAVTGALIATWGYYRQSSFISRRWFGNFVFFTLATASHGVLDALTDGGHGVAFFAPWDIERYFFESTPIAVSPIGMRFFSTRGLEVLKSEFFWIILPSLGVAAISWLRRRISQKNIQAKNIAS